MSKKNEDDTIESEFAEDQDDTTLKIIQVICLAIVSPIIITASILVGLGIL